MPSAQQGSNPATFGPSESLVHACETSLLHGFVRATSCNTRLLALSICCDVITKRRPVKVVFGMCRLGTFCGMMMLTLTTSQQESGLGIIFGRMCQGQGFASNQ